MIYLSPEEFLKTSMGTNGNTCTARVVWWKKPQGSGLHIRTEAEYPPKSPRRHACRDGQLK